MNRLACFIFGETFILDFRNPRHVSIIKGKRKKINRKMIALVLALAMVAVICLASAQTAAPTTPDDDNASITSWQRQITRCRK